MKNLSRLLAVAWLIMFTQQTAQASVIPSIPYNLTNGSLADATQVMGNFNTIVTDVNANAATNGANSNITSLTGLTTPLANNYGGTAVFTGGTTTGSANAQVAATVVPSSLTLAAGNIVTLIAGYTNSGATTLNANGTGVTAVRITSQSGVVAAAGGEIQAGGAYTFMYDGTYWQLLNPTLANVSNAELAVMNANTVKMNNTASSAVPIDATMAQLNAKLGAVLTVHKQLFTGHGTYTYTPTTGMVYVIAEAVDGGGGGGGVKLASSSNAAVAQGGYGGAYGRAILTVAQIGTSKTVTVGTGGGGGANTGGNGTGGTASSLGSLLVGVAAPGGTGSTNASTSQGLTVPSAGSSYGTADFTIPQQTFGPGFAADLTNSYELMSKGGDSPWGQGGFASSYIGGANTIAGNAGQGYGAGGSGAIVDGSTTGQIGGAGTDGAVLVTELCSQ